VVRAAIAAAGALLAWLIALALGVLGGSDPLPSLPSAESGEPSGRSLPAVERSKASDRPAGAGNREEPPATSARGGPDPITALAREDHDTEADRTRE
jgi:hypothetical protein